MTFSGGTCFSGPEEALSSESDKAERFLQHLEPLQGALEAYCRQNVNDPNAVEDVLQSAVANAFRDFHLYVERTNFRAWIFRYLNFEILNWNRRHRPSASERVSDETVRTPSWDHSLGAVAWDRLLEAPDAVLDYCEDELTRAIYELPHLERSVLLLRAIGEFRYREISEILEIPIGSVMGYLGRARAHVRTFLANCDREQGRFAGNG